MEKSVYFTRREMLMKSIGLWKLMALSNWQPGPKGSMLDFQPHLMSNKRQFTIFPKCIICKICC